MPVAMKTSNRRAVGISDCCFLTQPATMSWGLIPARERKRVVTHAWPRTFCSQIGDPAPATSLLETTAPLDTTDGGYGSF
jgi:hypothetical protein